MTAKETALLVFLQHLASATCRCTQRQKESGHLADCPEPWLDDRLIELSTKFNEESE